MDISIILSFLGAFSAGFVGGFSAGFSVAKYITAQYSKLLEAQRDKAIAENELLTCKVSSLESHLKEAQSLGSIEERSYLQIIESLKTSNENKDKQINALRKKLNTYRFSR